MKEYQTPVIKKRRVLKRITALGVHVLDRGLDSCKWKTKFCAKNCYNNKLMAMYRGMRRCQPRDSFMFEHITSDLFKGFKRVRLCSRGEPFKNTFDVLRVMQWARDNPDTTFSIPTRAWRDRELRRMLKYNMPKNVNVLASIDSSNTAQEIQSLVKDGWSTMFFGDDETPAVASSYKCPKTWSHIKGFCTRCANGCYKPGQKHIWLKKH